MNRETNSQTHTIENRDDIQVGHPLSRDTIRSTTTGYLATCNQHSCEWQGLFPTAALALKAVENHWSHARRNAKYHYGATTHTIVELVDDSTAQVLDESDISPLDTTKTQYTSAETENPTFHRTTGDLDAIVSTGDLIELPHGQTGKVWRVDETWELGLPTWTITFVDPDQDWPNPETEWERGESRWLNEMVAVDGTPVKRWNGQEYPVDGQADDFQAMIGGFADRASGRDD